MSAEEVVDLVLIGFEDVDLDDLASDGRTSPEIVAAVLECSADAGAVVKGAHRTSKGDAWWLGQALRHA